MGGYFDTPPAQDPFYVPTPRGNMRLTGGAAQQYQNAATAQPAAGGANPEVAAGLAAYGAPEEPKPAVPTGTPSIAPPVAEEHAAASSAPATPAGEKPRELGSLGKGRTVMVRPGGDPSNPSDLVVIEKPHGATKGGLQETTRTIKGGIEPSEEFQEQQTELEIDARLANQQAFDAETKRLAFEKGAADAQTAALADQAKEAEAKNSQASNEVVRREAAYDAAIKDYHGSTVDPKRYERDNKGAVAFTAILGAFNLAMSKGRDKAALDMLDNNIDRDIKQQETELNVKRDKAGNLLQDLQRKTGSRDEARSALKEIRLNQAANAAQKAALGAKTDEEKAKWMQADTAIREKLVNQREEYRQKTQGEVTRNLVNRPATGASAGGARLPTIAEQKELLGLTGQQLDVAGKQKKLTDVSAPKATGKQKTQLADIDASDIGLQKFAGASDEAGFVMTTGTGGWEESQKLGADAAAIAPRIAAATGLKEDYVREQLTQHKQGNREQAIRAFQQAIHDKRKAVEANLGGVETGTSETNE